MRYQKIRIYVPKNLKQNNSEAVTNENDKENYVYPEETQTNIDNLGINIIVVLKTINGYVFNGIKNNKLVR